MTERGRGSDAPPAFFLALPRGIRTGIPYRCLPVSNRSNMGAHGGSGLCKKARPPARLDIDSFDTLYHSLEGAVGSEMPSRAASPSAMSTLSVALAAEVFGRGKLTRSLFTQRSHSYSLSVSCFSRSSAPNRTGIDTACGVTLRK